jgi:cell division transport system permease protein
LVFLLSGGLLSWWRATPGGTQVDALFGNFALEAKGYGAILLIAAGIAVITGFVSRIIVFRHLRGLN